MVITKKLVFFFLPGGLLSLVAVVLIEWGLISAWLPKIVQIFPAAVLAAGILLGWRFNRSRLVFAVVVLAIAERSLQYFGQEATASGRLVYNSVAILLPLNIALLSLAKERGVVTGRGIFRICLILAQPLAVSAIWQYRCHTMNAYIDYPILGELVGKLLPAAFPQTASIAFAVAFLLVGYGLITRCGPVETGFFWALATVCFSLLVRGTAPVSTFYLGAAGLILVVSVIEASYAMAFRDELTGLPARRSLNEFLLRMGSRFTVAMVDIDFFKKVNDTYGHDVGDQVLAMVASKLAGVKSGGKAFRYGGEEFTVIFPGKSLDETMPELEQLRMAIESAVFVLRSRSRPRKKPAAPRPGKGPRKRVPVTVSIGVAERSGQHAKAHDVIDAADKALYRAKKSGRNRVCT